MSTKNTNSGRKSSGAKTSGRSQNAGSKRPAASKRGKAPEPILQPQVPEENGTGIGREISILVAFGVMVLLVLSNFHICGSLGEALSYFMFGVFGVFAYIAPILLFAALLFYYANIGNKKVLGKMAAVIGFILLFCALIQIIWKPYDGSISMLQSYGYCGEHRGGGGLVGGIIGYGLSMLIGFVGAMIVILLCMMILFVVVTERSIVNAVERKSQKVYENAKEDFEKRREAERRQRNLSRAKKRARGVTRTALPGIEDSKETKQAPVERTQPEPGYEETTENHTDEIFRPSRPVDEFAEQIPVEDLPELMRETASESSDFYLNTEEDADNIFYEPSAFEEPDSFVYATEEHEFFEPVKEESETFVHKESVRKKSEKEKIAETENIEQEIKKEIKREYQKPPLSLLQKGTTLGTGDRSQAMATARKLEEILKNFGVNVKVTDVSQGPSVTRYELQPELGTKVSRITSLTDDIKLNLAASDIRIEAPIPGKAAVGIEVPNATRNTVYLRDLIESAELTSHKSKIAFAAGKDIAGKVIVADIAKMPHMLIAGTTGSGKSVFTNSIIMSILFRATPEEVRLIIVDPKVVEFGVYNGIPHLLIPVVTDPRKAAGALGWAVAEMQSRYKKFAEWNVRDLKGYNEKIKTAAPAEGEEPLEPLPQIVIIIDELADLMMVAAKEVEESICRLAQLARAAGIHLIIATQRPSVDVVTGLIKANIPSRVALLVSSGVDSRTIIDMNGAEKLLGNGDMLFYPSGYVKPVRLQGAFVSDGEVQRVVSFLTSQGMEAAYDDTITNRMEAPIEEAQPAGGDDRDAYFTDAARIVVEKEKVSISMIQRYFKIGFNRAARIVDQLAAAGIVGEEDSTKPRKVLMTMEELEDMLGNGSEDRH